MGIVSGWKQAINLGIESHTFRNKIGNKELNELINFINWDFQTWRYIPITSLNKPILVKEIDDLINRLNEIPCVDNISAKWRECFNLLETAAINLDRYEPDDFQEDNFHYAFEICNKLLEYHVYDATHIFQIHRRNRIIKKTVLSILDNKDMFSNFLSYCDEYEEIVNNLNLI